MIKTKGFESLNKRIDNIQKANRDGVQKALLKIAYGAIDFIRKRTQSGKDINNSGFKPYSKEYAEYKQEKKRDASRVNLTFRSQMLDSIIYKPFKKGFKIYFNNKLQNDKASRHQLGNGVPKREFFGLGKYQQTIIDSVKNLYAKVV